MGPIELQLEATSPPVGNLGKGPDYTARIRRLPKQGLGTSQSRNPGSAPNLLADAYCIRLCCSAQEGGGKSAHLQSKSESLVRMQCLSGTRSWGLASAQAKTSASAGAPRIPGQNENGMQVYLRARLKTHGPGPHDHPQCANFAEPQVHNMLLRAIAQAGTHPLDELVDHKSPPAPKHQ